MLVTSDSRTTGASVGDSAEDLMTPILPRTLRPSIRRPSMPCAQLFRSRGVGSWRPHPMLAVLLGLVVALVPWRGAAAQDTGYIKVQCEPGVQIFLDGILEGVSSRDQEGLIIEGVAFGNRIVKALKPGFTPQKRGVSIGNGKVMVRFKDFRPDPAVDQRGEKQATPIQLRVGSILVKSFPVDCMVDFERANGGDGWELVAHVEKTGLEASVSILEIGTYRVTASRSNGALTEIFDLTENDEVTVLFNFRTRSIRVASVAARQEALKRRAEAAFVAAEGLLNLGNGVSMRFIEIEPGRFVMGSPASERGRHDDEIQRGITISNPFWIGQTEVTQAQWRAVMGSNPSDFEGHLNHPVENVSWNDAQEFCRRLSQKTGVTFRLPTEAEWEYACRAGTTTAYSFGDNPSRLDEYGWFANNSGGGTHSVATKKPNNWGLYDMHGNVWEWVEDWYGDYPGKSLVDPGGPVDGAYRVLRGGGWYYRFNGARSAYRGFVEPSLRDLNLGFRVAKTR